MLRTQVGVLLLAGSCLAPGALAQGKLFRDALPPGTLAYVSVPDLKTSFQQFQGTALAKMWQEEELQDFVKDALEMGKVEFGKLLAQGKALHEQGMLPVNPAELIKAPPQGMSFAITSAAIKLGEFGNPQPRFGLIGHVDLGEAAGAWTKMIRFGLQQLIAQAGDRVEPKTSKVGNVEITTLQAPGTDMGLNIAFMGRHLFLASLQSELSSFLTSVQEKQVGLSGTASFQKTFARLDAEGAEVEGYVNISGGMQVVMSTLRLLEKEVPMFPPELSVDGIEKALVAFGFDGMKAMGFTSSYAGDKAVSKAFMLAPAESRRGILAATGSGKVDRSLLRVVPKSAASVSLSSFDFSAIHTALVDALTAYNPEVAKQILARLKGLEEQVGVSVKDDLFGAFGNQMLFYSMGVTNLMAAPEGAVVLEVRNKDRLLANLNKAIGMAGGMVALEESERKGIKTWSLAVNGADPQMSMIFNVLKPNFGFKGKYMVLGLSAGDVRKTITRLDRKDDPTGDIRANKEFGKYLANIAQTDVAAVSWTDWRSSFEQFYGAASGALGFLGASDNIPFDLMLLPEAETLSKHLFSAFSYSSTDKDGFMTTSISPVGPEVMVGAVAVGMGAAVTFGMRAAPVRIR